MTDDLEVQLAEALEQRGRVGSKEVQRVLATAVLPARRSSSGGLARLVAVIVVGGLAVGALAIGLSNRGVAAPGPSPSAASVATGPVTGSAGDGTFKLSIATEHGTYIAGDPISVVTTLTYLGTPARVDVVGSGSGLVVFEVQRNGEEPVGGAMTDDCRPYKFVSGEPVTYPFTKSGGYIPGAPGADFTEQYLHDPLLHLPAGTWHIHALFTGSIDSCSPSPHTLDASVLIVVTDAEVTASQVTASQVASPAPTPTAPSASNRSLPDPARLASDPRYAVCTQAGMPGVLSAFEVSHARDLARYVSDFALSPELQSDEPVFVVVYAGPVKTIVPGGSLAGGNGPEPTLGPGRYDACVVIGAATAIHSHGFYGGVSFLDFDPAPSGLTPLP
jgi:hypothetical protein